MSWRVRKSKRSRKYTQNQQEECIRAKPGSLSDLRPQGAVETGRKTRWPLIPDAIPVEYLSRSIRYWSPVMTAMVNVEITESAQQYLKELLDKQKDAENIGIRMFVANPGTPQAETCIAYCRPGEEKEDDAVVELAGFNA